jgi:hypothetical protein
MIARAIDGDNYVFLASLDLSSAFDVVNIRLLLRSIGKMVKRLRTKSQ